MNKKIVFLPYDFDTALGTNNEGALVFSYNLEDIDQLSGDADVFNGQQSVLWVNVRAAFMKELRSMYQSLRSNNKLSYQLVEEMFEAHQSKWPEAVFNEDSWFKYLQPLDEDGDAAYLSMLQGSKTEQRKWWLYNRFRYIDSKYNAGDSLTDVITLRGYAKSNVVVTPYADVYASCKYGSYLVQSRAARNHPTILVCPLDNVNDTEIYIYSASQLAQVGDLSGFKVGYANFSMATKLQTLKLGDSDSEYENPNLTELYLGNNVLLRTLDVRNCPALGTGNVMRAVDISGCSNIEHIYFDGTSITGLTLPNGGIIKTLHLPDTITNLTIRNHKAIDDFVVPTGANITTLRIENVSADVQAEVNDIIENLAASSRVRLIGFSWSFDTYSDASDFYDILDTMRGLDESGGNVDTAQVLGTAHIPSLTGAQLASLQERYPDISITYDHITSNLYYYNYEGDTLLYTETIQDGGDGTYAGQPAHAATPANTFTFIGWAKQPNSTSVDSDARTAITADRNVYAAYQLTGRTYTVTFARKSGDGGGTLQTVNNVAYGGSATYTGTIPTTTQGNATDYPFEGWSPAPTNIQSNTTCYAVFGSPLEIKEITDSWDEILAAVANGTYATKYKVGNYKPIDLGTEGTVNMQIAAKDADTLASGSGTAALSWISKELLSTKHRMNPNIQTDPEDPNKKVEGTGAIGGWEKSEMRTYLKETIKPLIPANVRNTIVEVSKYSRIYDTSTAVVNNVVTTDDVWIPSDYETCGTYNLKETSGVIYDILFPNLDGRKKTMVGSDTVSSWYTRTACSYSSFVFINSAGRSSTVGGSNNSDGVCLGFCTGTTTTSQTSE